MVQGRTYQDLYKNDINSTVNILTVPTDIFKFPCFSKFFFFQNILMNTNTRESQDYTVEYVGYWLNDGISPTSPYNTYSI